jgi:hypothetical protein
MSGRVGHRKRLICVTAANLRENHYGASSEKMGTGKPLWLDMLAA